MEERIKQIRETFSTLDPKDLQSVEKIRVEYLGRNGYLTKLFDDFKNIPNEKKKEVGKILNQLKSEISDKVETWKKTFSESTKSKGTNLDLSLEEYPFEFGTRHPISLVKNELVEIFKYLGFTLYEGPEIEDDWHVFSALNCPEEPPARDMQDTF
ncbi:MAG: phenylalanine--tRNA ligase subunit alpha, partial [Candidatus Hydrothermia bacterium]